MRSDEELMRASGEGDLQAFEQIVLRHQSSAWNIACRFLGDPEEARDVVQTAFLKLLDAAPRYRPTAPFCPFLFQIVTRLCVDYKRKKRPVSTDELPDVEDNHPSPLERLINEEQERAVRGALDKLPPNQRAAIILRYYENLGYQEIAAVLGASTKAVERLLARGRAALGKHLAGWLEK